MRGINHLVLCARSLEAIRRSYAALGFTLCPSGQHPFGTGNTIIQLHGAYLELLALTRPEDVVEHAPGQFSFSAFNRDYLARHEGFSMLVFDSADAGRDLADWQAAGLCTHAPFHFSRAARMADGSEVSVGFALAFVSNKMAPWLGLFACQHFRPEYYAQPAFLTHANGATGVKEVWVSGPRALGLQSYLETVSGLRGMASGAGRIDLRTPSGAVVLAEDEVFRQAFGTSPPHPEDGPHLCGLTISCAGRGDLPGNLLTGMGERLVVTGVDTHGTALAFAPG